MTHPLGTIQQLIRYPVKSFGGEQLAKVQLTPYGLYGDRSLYFRYDDAKQDYLKIQDWPRLAAYRAALHERSTPDSLPGVTVTSPSGATYAWGDPALVQEISSGRGRAVTAHQRQPDEETTNFVDHILITTDASLRHLSKLWGHGDLDVGRFRSNIVLALAEDTPFLEQTWLGQHLQIGDAVLKLTENCERCSYINADPADGAVNASVLKTVVREIQQNFGIYASVVTPGEIKLGDLASLRP
ncbi:MOSC domain-containing protein [Tumebacillus permanentifrigoris]|uniref:MOSC domain-containing protein n=1 Tax=Tumebacillus permanentifrigoris TaxID=378543 RepID=A0A316D2H4_9BACL|nr:MOSC domain-containing protein [Tumebacillus permanentifrigoris]PWK04994.1 hypothetical protein C7459_1308 [Tumebacillus permanentifrigoris]